MTEQSGRDVRANYLLLLFEVSDDFARRCGFQNGPFASCTTHDKLLGLLDVLLLLPVLGGLRLVLLHARLDVHVVVAAPVAQLAVLHHHHVAAHAVLREGKGEGRKEE